MESLKINFKIYLEADDVSQSRIKSSTSMARELVKNSSNSYIRMAEFDDESDMNDFTIRFYVEGQVQEADCTNQDDAEAFLDQMAEIVDQIAHVNSFLDMEGSFSIEYLGEKIAYDFTSESGAGLCEFVEK